MNKNFLYSRLLDYDAQFVWWIVTKPYGGRTLHFQDTVLNTFLSPHRLCRVLSLEGRRES